MAQEDRRGSRAGSARKEDRPTGDDGRLGRSVPRTRQAGGGLRWRRREGMHQALAVVMEAKRSTFTVQGPPGAAQRVGHAPMASGTSPAAASGKSPRPAGAFGARSDEGEPTARQAV